MSETAGAFEASDPMAADVLEESDPIAADVLEDVDRRAPHADTASLPAFRLHGG